MYLWEAELQLMEACVQAILKVKDVKVSVASIAFASF